MATETQRPVKVTADEVHYADGTGLVRLISYGWAKAWPASQVKVGDNRLYNYGSFAKITNVENKGGWIHITVNEKGTEYTNKCRPNRLIPLAYWEN